MHYSKSIKEIKADIFDFFKLKEVPTYAKHVSCMLFEFELKSVLGNHLKKIF